MPAIIILSIAAELPSLHEPDHVHILWDNPRDAGGGSLGPRQISPPGLTFHRGEQRLWSRIHEQWSSKV